MRKVKKINTKYLKKSHKKIFLNTFTRCLEKPFNFEKECAEILSEIFCQNFLILSVGNLYLAMFIEFFSLVFNHLPHFDGNIRLS